MAETLIRGGEVWLVGAGPGDPELLTRKAERLLREATVVFYDALVGPGVLELIPARVRLEPVGKRSGRHSKDQPTINRQLIAAAHAGERVVRLKGGDPSIFGRSIEEVAALGGAGIPVHICPGVTTASAAAASATLSLTLRGVARSIQFVTAHLCAGEPLTLDWHRLADPQSTLAVYMGGAAAGEISRGLMRAGLDGRTPVLVACDVSLPSEHLLRTRLDLLPVAVQVLAEGRPTLILIGQALAAAAAARGEASAEPARS